MLFVSLAMLASEYLLWVVITSRVMSMRGNESQTLVDIFTGEYPWCIFTFLTKFLFYIVDNFLPQPRIRCNQMAKEITQHLLLLKIIKISLDHRYKARSGFSQDDFQWVDPLVMLKQRWSSLEEIQKCLSLHLRLRLSESRKIMTSSSSAATVSLTALIIKKPLTWFGSAHKI